MKKTKSSPSPEEQLATRKAQLLQDIKSYEQGIQAEVSDLKDDFQKSLRIGLTLLGFAVGAYWLLRSLPSSGEQAPETKSESKEVPVYEQKVEEDSIFAIIKREIALFLVALAKQKILEMMAAFAENTEETEAEAINPEPEDA